jgi:phosphoribosylformylglycinamidine synthase
MRNAGLKFICKMQHLKVCRANTPFTSAYKKNQIIKVAIAHGEGNYIADDDTIAMLEDGNRIAFRSCDAEGDTEKGNPNGSINSIAGIYSKKLNVLGMMPHPENLIETLVGGTDGRGLFASVTAYKGAA